DTNSPAIFNPGPSVSRVEVIVPRDTISVGIEILWGSKHRVIGLNHVIEHLVVSAVCTVIVIGAHLIRCHTASESMATTEVYRLIRDGRTPGYARRLFSLLATHRFVKQAGCAVKCVVAIFGRHKSRLHIDALFSRQVESGNTLGSILQHLVILTALAVVAVSAHLIIWDESCECMDTLLIFYGWLE